MNSIPVFLSIYVDAPVTIGKLHIGSYEVLYGYTSAEISVMVTTMKFVPKQNVSALESIWLVAKVRGFGYDIVHLVLE